MGYSALNDALRWLVATLPLLCAAHALATDITPSANVDTFVNVRASAGADSEILHQLSTGESLLLLGEQKNWYQVELPNGDRGFVHQHWTTKIESPPSSRVAGVSGVRVLPSASVDNYVNVRAAPTADSAIIGRLTRNTSLAFVSERMHWYEIQLSNGGTGFVHREWTMLSEPLAVADTTPATTQATKQTAKAPKRDRDVLVQPARLLEQKRSQDAYLLLAPMEIEWAGDTGYDYLYGLAALDSGRPGEAIFALERVVKLLPDFSGARMDLARALFDVGNHNLAEEEFVKLLQDDPPVEIRNVIAAYLDLIRNPPVPEDKPQSNVYLMLSGGYDSNANGAADLNTFEGFALDPRSTEQDSPFAELGVGAVAVRPLRPGIRLVLGADAKTRANRDTDYVDNTFAAAHATLAFTNGINEFGTGINTTWSSIDGSFNERAYGLNLSWIRPVRETLALKTTVSAGPAEYTTTLRARDLDMRLLYSVTLRQALQEGDLDWTLIGGRDLASDRSTPYTNKRWGARIGGRRTIRGSNFYWGAGAMKIPYSGTPFFGVVRDDKQYTANLAVEFNLPAKGWVLVPNISYVRNDSNVAIYDNERMQIGLQLRMVR